MISWDPAFISIGSRSFAFGSTADKAIARAQAMQQPSSGDAAAKFVVPLDGCRPTAVAALDGRSHVMAVEFPSAPAIPTHRFAFESSLLRDAYMRRLQVGQAVRRALAPNAALFQPDPISQRRPHLTCH